MKHNVKKQAGFTLLELVMAMSLFLTVLLLTTSGFIALNRTYTRGTVRRQLSEAVQASTDSVTQAIRRAPANMSAATLCSTASPNCTPNGMSDALSFASTCFFWNNSSDQSLRGGLYVANEPCQNDSKDRARLLADARYLVQKLNVTSVSGDLWQVSGIIRTANDDSFDDVNTDSVRCKGSAQGVFVQVCAVESFKFIVSSRGDIDEN